MMKGLSKKERARAKESRVSIRLEMGGNANSLDGDALVSKLVPMSDQTELNDGMLFRA